MRILASDYTDTVKNLPCGASIKVPHIGCSSSEALNIHNKERGFSYFCFKCGASLWQWHTSNTWRDREKRRKEAAALHAERDRKGYELPDDFSKEIPPVGLAWLGSCGWSDALINRYNIGWSEKLSRVIVPVHPTGWVGRAVFKDQRPKYPSKTYKGCHFLSGPIEHKLCFVEDPMSAGRVGVVYPAYALLGTSLADVDLLVTTNIKEAVIWTDNDTGGEQARKRLHKMLTWMPDIRTIDIRTEHDPKHYTLAGILAALKKGGASV